MILFFVSPLFSRSIARYATYEQMREERDYALQRLELYETRADAALICLEQTAGEVAKANAERKALAAQLEARDNTVRELRAIIDAQGLDVSKAIGGKSKRTKVCLLSDVVDALREPLSEYERQIMNLPVAGRKEFEQVEENAVDSLNLILMKLTDWVSKDDAKDLLARYVEDL